LISVFFSFFFKLFFFQFYLSTLGYWTLSLMIFFYFPFNFIPISYLGSWVNQVNPDQFEFFWHFLIDFFPVSPLFSLLKADLYCFIQFLSYMIILVSWRGYEFSMLTPIDLFYSFLKFIFWLVCSSVLNLLVIEL
jgi:hypothetical protein